MKKSLGFECTGHGDDEASVLCDVSTWARFDQLGLSFIPIKISKLPSLVLQTSRFSSLLKS